MFHRSNHLLITGNKKDFPSFIFDVVAVINVQKNGNGHFRAYYALEFNSEKFDKCYEDFEAMEKKSDKKVDQEKRLLEEKQNI